MNDLTIEEISKLQAAADSEMKRFLELNPEEVPAPLEAKLQIPFTDSTEFQQKIDVIYDEMRALSKANAHIQGQIQEISNRQEAETQARIESDKIMEQQGKVARVKSILNLIAAVVSAIVGTVAAVASVISLLG